MRKGKHKRNPKFLIVVKTCLVVHFMVCLTVILSTTLIKTAAAQEVFAQTGFEEFAVGNLPKDWEVIGGDFEVSGDTVKTDKKALAILGGGDGDGLGIPIETENPIISVEFYVYIEGGGRCFNLKVATADGFGENKWLAPTSTGTQALSGFSTVVRGNLLAILKRIHGNTSTLLPMSAKANLIFT